MVAQQGFFPTLMTPPRAAPGPYRSLLAQTVVVAAVLAM